MSRTAELGFAALVVAASAACSSEPDAARPPERDAATDVAPDVVEPKGSTSFSFVHGVVDAPRIAFCFQQFINANETPVSGVILPSGGLGFGETADSPDFGGFDWSGDDIRVVVLAGDIAALPTKDCKSAVASAAISVHPLALMPAGTISGGHHYAFVASGCIGGAGHDDPNQELVCGKGYAADAPTLDTVLLPLSRVGDDGHVGLQAVNAARAAASLDFVSPPIVIASNVAYGTISPWPPNLEHAATDYGATIQLFTSGSTTPLAALPSPLASASDGRNYALVLVGPDPSQLEAKWWHGTALALVSAQ